MLTLLLVNENYGLHGYFGVFFFVQLWWAFAWGSASACTYIPIEQVLSNELTIATASSKIAAQLFGGLYIYKYIYFIWGLQFFTHHAGLTDNECSVDLKVGTREKDK